MAQGKVTASSLILRAKATTDSAKIDSLPTGTVVDIIKILKGNSYPTGSGTRDDWYQVTVNGQDGFVAAAWIRDISVATPSVPTMTEIRGVWLLSHFNSSVLTSEANIKQALDFLEISGFNTLFVAVWNQGYTAFDSDVMARHGFPRQDPKYVTSGIDPLQEVINQAKGRNFAVFPWFEYGFAASPIVDGGHILTTKPPQWSALDSSGNKVRHGKLTWMNSLNPEVQQFITDLLLEVMDKYEIAGIQGCDRLPAMPYLGGYDDETKSKYRSRYNSDPPIKTQDPAWVQFRANLLTDYLVTLRQQVKDKDPSCIFSIAPSPFGFGLREVLQDSDNWVKKGLVDFLCPQFYRNNFSGYKVEVDRIKRIFSSSDRKKYVPGIAFVANQKAISTEDVVKSVKYNRSNGLGGQVFFFYEGLTNNSDAMASALKSGADYNKVAALPSLPFA
ncbi:MAG: family 10 glycosylhydrolase [Xenococcus sp. (in: cyanobacteria)]